MIWLGPVRTYPSLSFKGQICSFAQPRIKMTIHSPKCKRSGRRLAGRVPFKDRFKGPFKGPFKGRNRAASAEQLEVMQSYNSQETTNFFAKNRKFGARRRSERKQDQHSYLSTLVTMCYMSSCQYSYVAYV